MPSPRKSRKLAAEELFEYAVKSLGSQARSTGDLHARLRSRAAHPPDVDAIIARLKDIGYLDDRKFAESFAIARVENSGFGRMRVLTDLRQHRVTGPLADQAIEKALDGRGEAELIDAYIERRMASLIAARNPNEAKVDDKKLAAAYRRLRRAGFSSGPVLEALKRIAARPELLEDFPEEPEAEA
jgi:regulatory protein